MPPGGHAALCNRRSGAGRARVLEYVDALKPFFQSVFDGPDGDEGGVQFETIEGATMAGEGYGHGAQEYF